MRILPHEDLNANDYFRNLRGQSRATDRYNLFGAKLGGPVWFPKLYNGKEKTFFFYFEGLRRDAPYAHISSAPSEPFRGGDFYASPVAIYRPGTSTPFPNNRVPANLIDPAAAKIMGLLPGANSPGTRDAADGLSVNNLVEAGSTAL